MAREPGRTDCYAVNGMGLQINIGAAPGVGPIVGHRMVEEDRGDKTFGIPHVTKADDNGNLIEWRATTSGWVQVTPVVSVASPTPTPDGSGGTTTPAG